MKKGLVMLLVLGISFFGTGYLFAAEHAGEHAGHEHGGMPGQGGPMQQEMHGGKANADWLKEASDALRDTHPEHAAQLMRIAEELSK